MTRTFKDQPSKCRDVYTTPYDLAGLSQIISNNIERYDRWHVYITIGNSGNYIFGPYRIELNIRHGLWCLQSAETVYDLHMGNGCTEEKGELPDGSAVSIYRVLKKASPRWI